MCLTVRIVPNSTSFAKCKTPRCTVGKRRRNFILDMCFFRIESSNPSPDKLEDFAHHQTLKIYKIIGHESPIEDIALIQLYPSQPGACATFSDTVQPACLTRNKLNMKNGYGCFNTGWRDDQPILHQGLVTTVDTRVCYSHFIDYLRRRFLGGSQLRYKSQIFGAPKGFFQTTSFNFKA